MRGVEIHDSHPRGHLAFDLEDILKCLGDEALARTWTCSGVECNTEKGRELERLADAGEQVPGRALLELAERTDQVIEGHFRGRRPGEAHDSLIVKAIDSTLWEVFGPDDCLVRIRSAFSDVRPAEYEVD